MKKTAIFSMVTLIAVSLFLVTGSSLADGEWATSGNNIFNTNSGAVNINNPTGPGSHPLNVGSTGGSNIRLTGRDNAGQDEAAIMFQKYDGSTFHGLIQGIGGKLQFLGSSGTGLTVDSAGSIGIGTNNPQQKLHVSNGSLQIDGGSLLLNQGHFYLQGLPTGASRMYLVSGTDFNNATYLNRYNTEAASGPINSFLVEHKVNGNWVGSLEINSTGDFRVNSTKLFVKKDNGNVGIGTITPTAKLQVVGGGIKVAGASEFYDTVALLGTAPYLYIGSSSGAGQYGYLCWDDTNKLIRLAQQSSGGAGLAVNNVGNVGIGTTNPQSALAVNGTITTKKVKVTEVGWSDFVFADDYKLPSLAAVEDHIKKHKHLPGIPSAAEIGKKGLDVSDVLARQMQKIEELTLYLIEMKKENQEMKKENEALKIRIKALEEK